MTVVYSTAAKNARMTAVVNLLVSGTLQIGTTGMAVVLATFTLDATPATVSGGVLTFTDLPIAVLGLANGTAAAARFRDSVAADVITGLTVGTSGTDVIISNTSIALNQPVSLVAVSTITHAT